MDTPNYMQTRPQLVPCSGCGIPVWRNVPQICQNPATLCAVCLWNRDLTRRTQTQTA